MGQIWSKLSWPTCVLRNNHARRKVERNAWAMLTAYDASRDHTRAGNGGMMRSMLHMRQWM